MNPDPAANLYCCYRDQFPQLDTVLLTTDSGEVYTYGDAELRSAQAANYLIELGLQRGDRVSVQVQKSVENLWLYLGVLRAGMVFHPLNTAYTEDELSFFLQDAGTSLLVCDPAREVALLRLCQDVGVPHLCTLAADGSGSWQPGVEVCSGSFLTPEGKPSDLAALVYSSGTTGRPKGIMLSHANLIANVTALAELWGFQQADCLLHALPVYHVHGLFVAIGCVMMRGASMRWLPAFDVDCVLDHLPKSTVMMGVPTFYTRLLADARFSAQVCASVRLFISGSAPLRAETFEAFEQRTGRAILERYGMTETGMNTSNPLNGQRRAGTVGLPLPGVAVRICDAQNRRLPINEAGNLQVKGANVFRGYWNLPEKTADEFTPDGFFVTGDQGLIDEQGYITIIGRSKDMVISGGLNVYPKELELLIDAMEGVLESAVIGIPDEDYGEIVVAIVVPTPGSDLLAAAILDSLRARAASYKIPKQVHFARELPRNTMGKVQKSALREQYATVARI